MKNVVCMLFHYVHMSEEYAKTHNIFQQPRVINDWDTLMKQTFWCLPQYCLINTDNKYRVGLSQRIHITVSMRHSGYWKTFDTYMRDVSRANASVRVQKQCWWHVVIGIRYTIESPLYVNKFSIGGSWRIVKLAI